MSGSEFQMPERYGEVMRPLVIAELPPFLADLYRDSPDFRDWLHLYDKVARAEKVSSWTEWTPEQQSAYQANDTDTFSRLRGYTESEISDYKRSGELLSQLGSNFGWSDDDCFSLIYELSRLVATPEYELVGQRLTAMSESQLARG